jgi:hypothetical protein
MTWKKSPLKISNEEKFRIISLSQSRKEEEEDVDPRKRRVLSDQNSENYLQRITRSLFDDDNDHSGNQDPDDDSTAHNLGYDSSEEYMNDWKINVEGVTLDSPEVHPPPPVITKFDETNVDELIFSISQRHTPLLPSFSEFHQFLSSIEKSFPHTSPAENQIPVKTMRNDTLAAYIRTKVS